MPTSRSSLRTRSLLADLLLVANICTGSAAFGQNLVTNGHFHVDDSGWALDLAGTTLDRDGSEDEGGCAGSGAGSGTSAPGQMGLEQVRILQCVPIVGGGSAYLRFRHKGEGVVTFRLQSFQTNGCGGQANGVFNSSEFPQSADAWSSAAGSISVSGDTQSVELRVVASNATPHTFLLDGVELRYEDSIFVDDFEGNDGGESAPCRWVAP